MEQPCCAHAEVTLKIHDLEGSDHRQWKAIEEILASVELGQQTLVNLNHKLELHILEKTAWIKAHDDAAAIRAQAASDEERGDIMSHLKTAIWKALEMGLVGLVLWVILHWAGRT